MKQLLLIVLTPFLILNCTKKEDPKMNQLSYSVGKNVYDMELGDTLRNFVIHVPSTYDEKMSVPLLIMLHGSGGDGNRFYNISGWVEKAEEEGFIAVFPTGLEYPIDGTNRRSTKWSSDGLDDDIPTNYPIFDDVPFFRELIALCGQSFNIDKKRIYMSGFSNGGGFIRSRVIDEMDDLVAAASSGGGLGVNEPFMPQHGRYMPLYTISGNMDSKITEQLTNVQALPFSMADLYAIPQLKTRIDHLLESMKLSNEYSEQALPPQGNVITFDNDINENGQELKMMVVNGLEHNYPNGKNNPHMVNAPDILWPWYMKFQLY